MYTVLFADDTDAVRTLYCGVLRLSGYSVVEAKDGIEALDLASRSGAPIHLLITDIAMPRMDGLELWNSLKSSHPETGVLFITGNAADGLDSNAPVLPKPFTPAVLLAKVTELLAVQRGPLPVTPQGSSTTECI